MRSSVAATVVFGDDGEGLAPKCFAGLFIEADEHFAGVAIGFTSDKRVGFATCDSKGAETEIRGRFPDLLEAPFGARHSGDDAIACWTTERGPISGCSRGGRGERQTEDGGEVGACHDEKMRERV